MALANIVPEPCLFQADPNWKFELFVAPGPDKLGALRDTLFFSVGVIGFGEVHPEGDPGLYAKMLAMLVPNPRVVVEDVDEFVKAGKLLPSILPCDRCQLKNNQCLPLLYLSLQGKKIVFPRVELSTE
jgi:hypothetical protein